MVDVWHTQAFRGDCPISYTNNTGCHCITELFLKVTLNMHNHIVYQWRSYSETKTQVRTHHSNQQMLIIHLKSFALKQN